MMALSRLLLVSEPGRDGVFDHVAGLFHHLSWHHPETVVDLAFSSRRDSPELKNLVNAVRERGGKAVNLRIGNGPEPGDLAAYFKIGQLVQRRKTELVHAHSSKAGALCRVLRRTWPRFPPVVYTPHAYYGLGRKITPKVFVFDLLERILGYVGTTINVSFDERAFAINHLGLSPRRLALIENGIDVERFRPVDEAERDEDRTAFSLPTDGTMLVAVGRDSFQKNYRPLYLALDRILGDPSGRVFFVHAGAGAEKLGKILGEEARKRFRAYEHVGEVEWLLGAADAFILTSRYEGLALSALQALATGLKVFLTRVTGNAALDRIGFKEIDWIDFSENEEVLADRIETALRKWLAHGTPPSAEQAEVARQRVSAELQYEKIWRLYQPLAVRWAQPSPRP
jgi:glycosyltransferase involved in cell wall biosynthesis